MAPKKNKQFYAYYFSTKDGPENRNKKYHIDSLEDISLYDGDQPLKLARIQVRNKPWTVKSDDPNERWPDLLVDIRIYVHSQSFSSMKDVAVNDEDVDDTDDLPNWLRNKKGCSILKRTNNYDFIDDIVRLLCTETYYYKSSVVEHNRDEVSKPIEITDNKMVVCKAPVCEGKCAFKNPHNDMTVRPRTEHPDSIPIIEKLDEKFIDYLDLIAPKLYGRKLYQLQKINTDPRKSIKFRIMSKRDSAYTSIHTLTALRGDIATKTQRLAGSMAALDTGIADWMFFLEHFTENCFITRPAKKN
uniref:Uncharacterized protein n=1 Tax=Tetranychus urticae TaxID=32264 RepID=T1KI27_TETUR